MSTKMYLIWSPEHTVQDNSGFGGGQAEQHIATSAYTDYAGFLKFPSKFHTQWNFSWASWSRLLAVFKFANIKPTSGMYRLRWRSDTFFHRISISIFCHSSAFLGFFSHGLYLFHSHQGRRIHLAHSTQGSLSKRRLRKTYFPTLILKCEDTMNILINHLSY